MIELKELRVGNLVQTSNIIELNAWHLYLIESKRWVPRAIPLTEEWLLKAGFEQDFEGIKGDFQKGRILIRLVNHGPSPVTPDFCWTAEINTEKQWCELARVPYVHQLQNLYFALTGEELTFDTL